ncbi:Chitosanase-domain-containing protein [Dentipellis sp. KUC8613]|nr:Chitosanase-domain-containing protein [Dentipellis sp. KUC8613]
MGSPNSFALLLLLFITIPSILARSTELSIHQAHHKRAYNLRSSVRRRKVANFAAASDISSNAEFLLSAATASKKAGKNVVATFPAQVGDKNNVDILGDWLKLDGVSAYHFIADMDVDCDGVDFKCAGNPDGQSETSFGALNAAQVPFYVLPLKFTDAHKDIKPNSLGAIVCNKKIVYGIYGDQNGDDPQVIGEASIVLAQACFPDDKLSGDNGHTPLDVLYIVFGSQVPKGVGKTTIDVDALKTLGDQQTSLLVKALGGNGAAPTTGKTNGTKPAKGKSSSSDDDTDDSDDDN